MFGPLKKFSIYKACICLTFHGKKRIVNQFIKYFNYFHIRICVCSFLCPLANTENQMLFSRITHTHTHAQKERDRGRVGKRDGDTWIVYEKTI